jgi:hypothetical protein
VNQITSGDDDDDDDDDPCSKITTVSMRQVKKMLLAKRPLGRPRTQ